MLLRDYLAHQLGRPTGIIGKYLLGPLWNRRNEKLNEITLAHLDLQASDCVLDIGFGGGYLIGKMIPRVTGGLVAGVDVSPEMVLNGRKRWRRAVKARRVMLQCASAEALPYPNGFFTKVSSVNSVFYWQDAKQAVSEIYRTLCENGRTVLTYTRKIDLEKKWFIQHGVHPYEDEAIQLVLVKAGFREISAIPGADRHRQFVCLTALK